MIEQRQIRRRTPESLLNSWCNKKGKECKDYLTPEMLQKCLEFFGQIETNGGYKIMPQRFRQHLVDFVRYNVPGNWFEISFSQKGPHSVTENRLIVMYGPIEGLRRWRSYCEKQAETNTFEYKKVKYGMTEDEFKQYNKSRSVTLENCIKRHGEEKGTKVFEDYCKKQKDAGTSLRYFQQKYGVKEGTKKYQEVCTQKRLTLDNFIRKYGQDEGQKRYLDYFNNLPDFYSAVSQKLFWDLYTQLQKYFNDLNVYFAELNQEYGVYDNQENVYKKFDFVILHPKISIEYDGDHYHGNPAIYRPEDYLKGRGMTKTKARDKWADDAHKSSLLESQGFKMIRIWDSEYNSNPVAVTDRLLKEIIIAYECNKESK